MDHFERVCGILSDILGCEAGDIKKDAVLKDDLGADSLSAVEIVMALEDAFGITIPEEKTAEIKTVADILALVWAAQ